VEARARLPVDGVVVRVGNRPPLGCNGSLQVPHRAPLRAGEPDGLVLPRGDRNEQPEVTPGDGAIRERASDRREVLQTLHHARELLQLPAGEAQALPRVVVEPGKPKPLVALALDESGGEVAEDAAAESVLAGEAAEEPVEQLGGQIAIEPAVFSRGERHQKLFGDEAHMA
jgi:hypothetical protein